MQKVYRSSEIAAAKLSRTALTIGNFDGVHRGHQALLERAVELARGHRLSAVALTFDPPPSRYFRPETAPPLISTEEQKLALLHGCGIDVVVVEPFDSRLASMSPEQFVQALLAAQLHARHVVVGQSFAFGKGRSGDLEQLSQLGQRYDFAVHSVPTVEVAGGPVSSTRIRELVRSGVTEEAAMLLGRPFALEGRVASGAGRGRTIGIPTANLEPDNQLVPAFGVYAVHAVTQDGTSRAAVVNIGVAPTFGGEERARIEAHLLDFHGNLLWQRLRLDFRARLRAERRFSSADELVHAIKLDIERARELLRS